jgi:hypothetical protein
MKGTVIVSLVAIVLIAVVGVAAYQYGYTSGNQAAQNTRAEFFANRQGGQAGFGQNGQGQTPNQNSQGQANNSNNQNARGNNFARPAAAGTVKSVQGNTFVVSEQNGNSVTVNIDSQTQISKTVTLAGQASDLQAGARVSVTSDQTGATLNARQIMILGQGTQ